MKEQGVLWIALFLVIINGVVGEVQNGNCECHDGVCYSEEELALIKDRIWKDIREFNLTLREAWYEPYRFYFDKFWINPDEENTKKYAIYEAEIGAVKNRLIKKFEVYKPLEPFLRKDAYLYYLLFDFLILEKPDVPEEELAALLSERVVVSSKFENSLNNVKFCDYATKEYTTSDEECNVMDIHGSFKILRNSEDPDELAYTWTALFDNGAGQYDKELLARHFYLGTESSRLSTGKPMVEAQVATYGVENKEDFYKVMKNVMNSAKPLMQQLHAYVRRKLREKYGEKEVSKRGMIPIKYTKHYLGQSWTGLYDLVIPYPESKLQDPVVAMKEQGYTPMKLVNISLEFFKSLGFPDLDESYHRTSNYTIQKKNGPAFVSYNYDHNKVPMSMFMKVDVSLASLVTLHHELGHAYTFKVLGQKFVLEPREANYGIHEGHGDALGYIISSPKHLHYLNLIDSPNMTPENEINFLLKKALEDFPFLSFSYTIDTWRWNVLDSVVDNPDQSFNLDYWKLRHEFGGVKAPTCRYEGSDPLMKTHIAIHYPYFSYNLATIGKYMAMENWCKIAGEFDPTNPDDRLYNCDVYGSKAVGDVYWGYFQLNGIGGYKPSLKALTGYDDYDATPILTYFKPLYEWLKKDNEEHGEYIGWEDDSGCEY